MALSTSRPLIQHMVHRWKVEATSGVQPATVPRSWQLCNTTHPPSISRVGCQNGGAFAPQKDADPSWYGNPVDQQIGLALKNATTFRFDASDLMPGSVGAGSFWKEMTSWASGSEDMTQPLSRTLTLPGLQLHKLFDPIKWSAQYT